LNNPVVDVGGKPLTADRIFRQGRQEDAELPAGSAELTTLKVEGGATDELVRAALGRVHGRGSMCYRRLLATKPTVNGSLSIRLVVDQEGKVSGAKPVGDAASLEPVAMCMAGRLRRITVAGVTTSGTAIATWSFSPGS
jgi:hypothetical protein